jgi:hypothetical protein
LTELDRSNCEECGRIAYETGTRALPQLPLLLATDWSPLLFGEQHIESRSVETT